MPFTPFHFGPGAALHAIAPKYVSFLSFCTANVVIDLESLYNLRTNHYPVHEFLHTYLGATIVALATVLLFVALRGIARVVPVPNPFLWQELTPVQISIGAAAGAYSHVVVDSIMHADMAPLAPLSHANALLGAVSLDALHWFCLVAGSLGVLLIALRKFLPPE